MKFISVLALVCGSTAFQIDASGFAWMREAEKKHARAAMVALPSLALIASATGGDPVPWLNSQPAATQLFFYSSAGILETLNLRRVGEGFALKEGEVPGRTLPWVPEVPTSLDALEDTVGRTAMIVVAATLASSAAGVL